MDNQPDDHSGSYPPPTGSPIGSTSPPGSAQTGGAAPGSAPPAPGSQAAPPPPGPQPNPVPPPAPAGPGGGWYSGPWPAPGLEPRESTGSAIGRTAIMSITALIVLLGLPVLALILLISTLAGISSAAGGPETADIDVPRQFLAGERSGETNLVAVPVIGGILGEERGGGGLFASTVGVTYGYSIKERLLDLAEDDSVDGILLELDSPGGTVFGSKAIADGVAEYRERTGKPVVAYVGGISASGGVYAMAGADEIVADHGTLIGSIGVIFGPFVRYNDVVALDGGILGGGVTTEGGIEFDYLTAGRGKDLGSPYRDMTAEEKKVLEEGLDDAYEQFVAHVAEGRGLTVAEIENDLGALIYGEEQAMANGLIDTIGSRDVAYARLAELAGADGDDWRLDRATLGDPGFWDLLAGAAGPDPRSDESGSPATGADAGDRLPTVCTGSAALLAYHGDPTLLCAPLLD